MNKIAQITFYLLGKRKDRLNLKIKNKNERTGRNNGIQQVYNNPHNDDAIALALLDEIYYNYLKNFHNYYCTVLLRSIKVF